jgi:hypothetical protein
VNRSRAGIPLSATARLPSFLAGPNQGSVAASGWCYSDLWPLLAACACNLCCAPLSAQPRAGTHGPSKFAVPGLDSFGLCRLLCAWARRQLHRAMGPVPSKPVWKASQDFRVPTRQIGQKTVCAACSKSATLPFCACLAARGPSVLQHLRWKSTGCTCQASLPVRVGANVAAP